MPTAAAISVTLWLEKSPRRDREPSFLPLAGWDEANDWRGYYTIRRTAAAVQSAAGYIATANNKIVDAAYPYYLSNFFEPPQRIRRINQLLQAQDKFTAEDMASIQLDLVSLHAVELIQALSADLEAVANRQTFWSHDAAAS